MRYSVVATASFVFLIAAATSPQPWAFPGAGSQEASPARKTPLRVSGSTKRYSRAALGDMAHAPDWFPASHPAAPAIVLNGTAKVAACGYCHLPDGSGRIENADLRGLPVSYIEEQVRAFANGARRSADPHYAPTRYMAAVARAVRPADLRAAARYFSALDPISHSRVVETAKIPRATAWHYVYRFDRSVSEPIGLRILEGPDDPQAFELRDPRYRATAWVPPGSIARGRAIATRGTAGVPACQGCHSMDMVGIGGASPTFIARQLLGFRAKARNDPGSAPMQAVAAKLTDAQIIDVAAYAGSHRPWTHKQMQALMANER